MPRLTVEEKKQQAFKMVRSFNQMQTDQQADPNISENQRKIEHDPAKEYDERGRLKRWQMFQKALEEPIQKCCTKIRTDPHEDDQRFMTQLEHFNSQFYENLESSKRAIANW